MNPVRTIDIYIDTFIPEYWYIYKSRFKLYLFSIQCSVFSVQCTVFSVQYINSNCLVYKYINCSMLGVQYIWVFITLDFSVKYWFPAFTANYSVLSSVFSVQRILIIMLIVNKLIIRSINETNYPVSTVKM